MLEHAVGPPHRYRNGTPSNPVADAAGFARLPSGLPILFDPPSQFVASASHLALPRLDEREDLVENLVISGQRSLPSRPPVPHRVLADIQRLRETGIDVAVKQNATDIAEDVGR